MGSHYMCIATNLNFSEYAVREGLIESKGDRQDVPNFVLVLTDGRSTDDVSIGAPKLREKVRLFIVQFIDGCFQCKKTLNFY